MAFSNVICVTLSLFVCLSAAGAENSGVVVRVTQKGLDYGCQEGMSVLHQELVKVNIPDFSGTTSSPLGTIKYNVYGMTVQNFHLPNSKVSPVRNVGLKLSISGAFIEVNGNWKSITKFLLSFSGEFDANVEGVRISVGLKLGSDILGRPTITPYDFRCQVANANARVPGRFGWLINIFNSQVNNALKKAIESQICPLVQNTISRKLEPLLQTLLVTANIDKVAAIDYALTGPPLVTAEYVDVQLKGEFFQPSHHTAPPFSPPPLSLPTDHNLMVYFGVSDYLFNTAGFVYHSAGNLVFIVTDDMIPKDFKTRLNTQSFGVLIPRLSRMYPNTPMRLKISSTLAPFLDIKQEHLTIFAQMDIQAYVMFSNGALAPVFLLNVKTSALVTVSVISGRIVGNLEQSRLQIDLKRSDAGPFSVEILNAFVNFCISDILLPHINDILNECYPLPMLAHLQLTNVVIQPHENFLVFGADVHY